MHTALAAGLALAFSLTAGAAARADDGEGSASGHSEDRTLGGYRFIPSTAVPEPFVTSHFRNSTGAGMFTDADLPLFEAAPDSFITLSGDLIIALLEFEYSYAPDDVVSFRIAGAGATRVGTGSQSILAQGVTAATSMSAGTTIRIHRSDKFLVSGGLDVGPLSTIRVDLAQFVRELWESGFDDASLTQENNGILVSGGGRAAYAFNEWSGIFGMVNGLYANSVLVERGGVLAAAAVSADLGQRGGIPLGFTLTGRYNSLNASDPDTGADLQLGLGVFYTGRETFSVGLESQYVRLPVSRPDTHLDGVTLELTTRFYF